MINFRKNFQFKDISLLNFVNLSQKEKEMVRRWRNNLNIRKWMLTNKIITLKEHLHFIDSLKSNPKDFYWLVRQKSNGYFGVIYLNRVNQTNKNAYMGIYVNPYAKVPGRGELLLECLRKMVFKLAKMHTLKLEVMENNKRAFIFYQKHGFKIEGRLQDFVFRNGGWQDLIVMGIKNAR